MKRRFAASLAATALSITTLTGIVATPAAQAVTAGGSTYTCLLYTSPSPRDRG